MLESVVHHEKYGRGVVKASRHKGFQLQVAFDNGLTQWVRLDELATPRMEDVPPPVVRHEPPDLDGFTARRMIEAFRLGVVPYDCVADFIFGRSAEIQCLAEWLDAPDQNALLTVGEYGTGKTHFLHYAYAFALQAGFAVARVDMDANECPFHRPKRVYSRLVRTLRFLSAPFGEPQSLGFRDFLKQALDNAALADHIYFKCLLGKTSDETLWDWIEARDFSLRPPNLHQRTKINTRRDFDAVEWNLRQLEDTLREVQRYVNRGDSKLPGSYMRLPGLYPYFKAANIYCYLLSALGWAAKEILGLKGLLLIFDEAETVDRYDNLYQSEKSQNFLTALIRTANDDDRLLGRPGESGLDYCRMGIGPSVPFLFKQPSGLKLLFALTPIDTLNGVPDLLSAEKVDLTPLTEAAKRELFRRIFGLYQRAYGGSEANLSPDTMDMVFGRLIAQSGLTRLFVKGTIEALDFIRLGSAEGLTPGAVLDNPSCYPSGRSIVV